MPSQPDSVSPLSPACSSCLDGETGQGRCGSTGGTRARQKGGDLGVCGQRQLGGRARMRAVPVFPTPPRDCRRGGPLVRLFSSSQVRLDHHQVASFLLNFLF